MNKDDYKVYTDKMKKSIDSVASDFAAVRAGRAVGGHLNRAVISATCEMIVTLISGTVDRAFSEQVGLNLFKF